MKLFLDTIIFVEFVGRREQFEPVSRILDAILEDEHIAFISSGSIYTLTYLFERSLKEQDVHRPEQTHRLRALLSEVLNMATVLPLSHIETEKAVHDEAFIDIEDSYQYHCALENHCSVLITVNSKDFKDADQTHIEIMTPTEFVEKYM